MTTLTHTRRISRRTLTAGLAWTVPAVAVAGAAPAFAASCTLSTTQNVTWAANADNDSSYRTQTGTTANTSSVSVTTAFTGTSGGIDTSFNMSSRTVATTNDSIIISNDVPYSTSTPAANYQDVTFTFSKPVYNLTFTIDDIDRINNGGTYPGYYDQVALLSLSTYTATKGSYLTGSGTTGDPWRTAVDVNGSYDARQSVTVSFAGPVTSFTIRFWTSTADSRTTEYQFIRLGSMSYRTCA